MSRSADTVRELQAEVERLREKDKAGGVVIATLNDEITYQKAEVERLRAEETYMAHHLREATEDVERLRAALEQIEAEQENNPAVAYCARIARAALSQTKETP